MYREPFAAAVVACLIAVSLLAAHAGGSATAGRGEAAAVHVDEAGGEVRPGQGYFEEQFKVYGGR